MSTDLRAIMDRDERRRRMLNDPDLVGDALLFALALDEVLATRKEQRRRLGSWVDDVAELAWGPEQTSPVSNRPANLAERRASPR